MDRAKAEALVWLDPGTTGRVEQQEGEGWGSRFKVVGGRGQEQLRPWEQLKLHPCPLTNRCLSEREGSWVPLTNQAGVSKNARRPSEGSALPVKLWPQRERTSVERRSVPSLYPTFSFLLWL